MDRALKNRIRKRYVAEYGHLLSKDVADEDFKAKAMQAIQTIVGRELGGASAQDKDAAVTEMLNELLGYGPIENLMNDPRITEIMINGTQNVYMEKDGSTRTTDITFDDDDHLMYLVHKLLLPTRRRVDESYPYTEISFKDGCRVNIIIPPLALDGPAVTIRKFLKDIKVAEDLVNLGTMDKRISDFLVAAIKVQASIIFSGATGAGKTTTLNVLSSYISDDERIVTIEDTAELRLKQRHVVRLESRQPNIEGRGEVTIRDLFKNCLRMRPDRIILGEIRSGEALDMLQAICSGHRGSLAVIHAHTAQDVIFRLETMVLTSGVQIGLEAIHRQIAASINLIVQQEQLVDGSRKITQVAQVSGLKDGQVVLEDIFFYEIEGVDADGKVRGKWKATGVIPNFYHLFVKTGVELPPEIFSKGR